MSANLNYVIRLDAETQGLRQANLEWRNFIGSVKAGVGIDIGGRLVAGIQELNNALKSAGMAGVMFRSKIEDLTVSYRTLLGSSELANMRIAELAKFAAATPFELPGIGKANKILETLTKGALSGMDGMKLVGDAAAVADAPIEDLAMSIGRVYDALQSGRSAGEAMRRLQELGLVSGETRNKIEALQAAGEKGPAVWNVAKEALSRYAGEMDARAQTMSGRMSTLRDAWNAAMGEMMAGATGAASGGAKDLADALAKPETVQALREMGVQIRRLTEDLAKLAGWAVEHGPKIVSVIMSVGKAMLIAKAAQIVGGGLTSMAAGIAADGGVAAATGGRAAAGGIVAAGGLAAAGAAGNVGKTVQLADSRLLAEASAAKAHAAEMATKAARSAERAAAFTTAAQTAQIAQGSKAAMAARYRAEAALAEKGAADAAIRAEAAATRATTSMKTVQMAGGAAGSGGTKAPIATFGGVLGAVGIGLAIGSMVQDLVQSYADRQEAAADTAAAEQKADKDRLAGLRQQLAGLDSVAAKKALLLNMDQQITAAQELGNNGLAAKIGRMKLEAETLDESALAAKEKAAAEKKAKEESDLNAKVNRKALDKMNVEIAQDKSAFQEKFQSADRPEQMDLARQYIAELRKEQEANNPENFIGGDQEEFKEKAARYKQLYSEITSWEQRLITLKKADDNETAQARKATLRDLRGMSIKDQIGQAGKATMFSSGLMLSSNAQNVINGGGLGGRPEKPLDPADLKKIRDGIEQLVELNKKKEDASGLWAD